MPTVGDVLFAVRSKIVDMPPTLPVPTASAAQASSTGSTLPAGTYFVVVTQRNPWGETIPSTESSVITIGANQGIQVTSTLFPGALAIRAYLTPTNGASGTEMQFVESATSPFIISSPPTAFGTPPIRATAYLMDSDGQAFGASIVYQWLNEGLNKLTRIVGGVQDYSGVPTVAGQSMYVALGEWAEISDVWYGGYWVKGGKRMDYFRRNTVTSSILSRVTVSVFGDKQVLEVNYQPDRTSGVTTTTASMTATDTTVAIVNPGAFLLPFGFAQIGTEIVAYASLAGGAISGLIRGLGSTEAKAWPGSTTVTELSLFWCGKRLTMNAFQPGQSLSTLPVPQGWAAILPDYMLAQAKKSELDNEEARKLEDSFLKQAQQWLAANKPVARFVQVSGGTGIGETVSFDQVLGQGVIVP